MRKIFDMINNFYNNWKKLIRGEDPKLIIWIFPLLMATIYLLVPYLLTLGNPFGINYKETGQIGDTIGGISTPLISIFGAFLTFLAFWVQFQSNKKQTAQFDAQDKAQKVARFENKFYQLLKIHKDNVSELRLENGFQGKSVFEGLLLELELSYDVLKDVEINQELTYLNLTESDRINIAYITFFIGIKDRHTLLNSLLSKYPDDLIESYISRINEVKRGLLSHRSFYEYESDYIKKYFMDCEPFNGHLNRLGHYFRHLFHMYNLVDKLSEELEIDKIDFTRIIRTQMSSIEQIHLYYNIQSTFGQNWIKFNFVQKYKVFRNMPLPLARFGMSPVDFLNFHSIPYNDFFEWEVF